jgi:peptidoglycan-N-acetylglucosamine deacetylase
VPSSGQALDPRAIYRRRRLGAVCAAVALVVILVLVLLPHGGAAKAHRRRVPQAPARSGTVPQTSLGRREHEAVERVLSYTPAVTAGGDHGHEMALTFDDGPGPYTQQLVGVLNHFGVKATFFVIGEEERWFSEGTRLELRSGDVIGDHTETHPMMALLSAHAQHEELFEQIARVELLGAPRPQLFRPPYGSFNATTFKQLRRMRLLMVLWSTDTSDYTKPGVAAIVHAALAGVHPGSIILMHDAGGDRAQTIAALPAIIRGLRRRGLRPVTIPRLLLDDPPARGQPVPTSLAGD